MRQNILLSCLFSLAILIPLGWKWELEKRIFIPASLLIGVSSGIITSGLRPVWSPTPLFEYVLNAIVIASMALALLLWRFYRDPERITPEQPGLIVAPADGRVIYIKNIQNGEIPFSVKKNNKIPLVEFIELDSLFRESFQIGIAMNYLDVHVNRAPVGGHIIWLKHIKGMFISLKHEKAVLQNERVLTVLENENIKIGIIQIASRLVRKIVLFIVEGQNIRAGERIGCIRFGSQVDMLVPKMSNLTISVTIGQCVKAGETIIATLQ